MIIMTPGETFVCREFFILQLSKDNLPKLWIHATMKQYDLKFIIVMDETRSNE